ncbi:Fic family protein [Viscerimonas tarda]|nr:adenosine monophosphate-protein transferase [Bacteroidia bacterium]GHV70339.1 adenosine monophosphate-protein transferase [Bacteroidia bacterium]
MSAYQIQMLPLQGEVETRSILKKLASARGALAEMKGVTLSIPNERILINTLALQEAKDSSEIENIITTQDELFQSDFAAKKFKTVATKEVYNYAHALLSGFENMKKNGLLTLNQIIDIQSILEETRAGFRKLPGTELKNERTGETVYTPPQSYDEIVQYMNNLEQFINDETLSDLDPLVKLAIIHHQFESIHPFYDGNGRTGRIINILYLVKEKLLDIPVLYLSRFINQNKGEYYSLLQKVRTENAWEAWILFMLDGVEQTSRQTITIIQGIKTLMQTQKHKIREELPKIYSQDLLNSLFKYPYTKIDFIMEDLMISKSTAIRYLDGLTKMGVLDKQKIWKESYYINNELYTYLSNVNEIPL